MTTKQAIQQKLKNTHGASMVMALVFFLFCTVIGGILLTSAAANAGRLGHMRQEQQSYLTVSSAARLLREELQGSTFQMTRITISDLTDPAPTSVVTAPDSVYTLIEDWGLYRYNVSAFLPAGNLEIRSSLEDVSGTFQMDDAYNITVPLTLTDGDASYSMTLTLPATVEETRTVRTDIIDTVRWVDGEAVPSFYIRTTVTTVTTVKWRDGTIEKGVTP